MPAWPVIPLIAVVLDMWLRDPPHWPHPVRLVGLLLNGLEKTARSSAWPLRLTGTVCMLFTASLAGFVVWTMNSLPYVGWFFALYFSFAGLALGGLLQEGRHVLALLREDHIDQARDALARLVSRDVHHLDQKALRRALAETISENLNDAFTAPFFYLMFLGPTGMWVYKAVSTMDSMWGYKTAQWRKLGWAAARADDVLAFIPARLTALCLLGAGRLLRCPGAPAWTEVKRLAVLVESPNAGWPMAAAALLLQAGMGGPTQYFGKIKDKPWLGPRHSCWTDDKLFWLLRVVAFAGLGFAMIASLLFFLILQIFT